MTIESMGRVWLFAVLVGSAGAASAQQTASPKPELTVQSGHTKTVTAVAFLPDGKHLASAGMDMTLRIWDLGTGEEIRTIRRSHKNTGYIPTVDSIEAAPDGNLICSEEGLVVIDPASGKEVRTFPTSLDPKYSGGVTKDGNVLTVQRARDGKGYTVVKTDYLKGVEVRTLGGSGTEGAFTAVALSPDGGTLAIGDNKGGMSLTDTSSGKELAPLEKHQGQVQRIAFSPDGRRFASASDDATVRIWDSRSGKVLHTIKMEKRATSALFTPDGSAFVAAGWGQDVRMWDVSSGKLLRSFVGHTNGATSLALSPDGTLLASGSGDNSVRIWDMRSGAPVRVLAGGFKPVDALAASRDGRYLVSVMRSGRMAVWDLARGTYERALQGGNSVAISSDSRTLISGGTDRVIRTWDMPTGRRLLEMKGHEGAVTSVAVTRDGRLIVSGSDDKTVRVWDAATGDLTRLIPTEEPIRGLALTPDDKGAVLAGDDTFSVVSFRLEMSVRRAGSSSGSHVRGDLAVSGDGKLLIAGWRPTLLMDPETLSEIGHLSDGVDIRTALALSPDGTRLLTGYYGTGSVPVWEIPSGRKLLELQGHSGGVNAAAWTVQKQAVTGGEDGTVRFWNAQTGQELCRLYAIDDDWIAVSPEGYFDASPGGMRKIRWTVGMHSYPLEAFSEGYYMPGLLARKLKEAAVTAAKLPRLSEGFALPPSVKIVSPSDGAALEAETAEVVVEAADQGGGIDEIRLYHNGKAVGAESRGMKAVASRRTQRFQVRLADGENTFQAVALSRNRIESNPAQVSVTCKGPAKGSAMHVVAVGINKYKNPALSLNFARGDAEGVLAFFASHGGSLFREVKTRELYDQNATKAGILAALDSLGATRPEDVAVIYFAGHGDSVENTWYFVPYEVVNPENEDAMRKGGLSSKELQERIKNIGARKVLVMMDACKSGAALLAFAGRGLEDRKALSQLARAAGVHVVAASTGEQIAAEVKDLGHGVFTHTLLEALKGKADGSPKDDVVTVRELVSFVESELPEISQKYKSEAQYPVVDSRGMDFPLTVVK